jgi:hypothetical protein
VAIAPQVLAELVHILIVHCALSGHSRWKRHLTSRDAGEMGRRIACCPGTRGSPFFIPGSNIISFDARVRRSPLLRGNLCPRHASHSAFLHLVSGVVAKIVSLVAMGSEISSEHQSRLRASSRMHTATCGLPIGYRPPLRA